MFWILAIAGSLAGKITVQRNKQKTAGLIGTVFIALGLILFILPSTPQVLPSKRESQILELPISSQSSASSASRQTLGSAVGGPLIRPPPPGRSVWAVDKSTVYLEPTGDKRQFFLVEPSVELASQGAQSGALLFDGRKVSGSYEGKLFVFAGLCGTRDYDATGPITNEDETVTLLGMAPQIDPESCAKIGEQKKTLVFNFKRIAH